jgi:hypothetical protein
MDEMALDLYEPRSREFQEPHNISVVAATYSSPSSSIEYPSAAIWGASAEALV